MSSGVLNADKTESDPFDFRGDCYICLKGSGTVSIVRSMDGGEYDVLTTERGEEMTYVGDGVLFNSVIHCKKGLKHKIVANTTDQITYKIVKERQ